MVRNSARVENAAVSLLPKIYSMVSHLEMVEHQLSKQEVIEFYWRPLGSHHLTIGEYSNLCTLDMNTDRMQAGVCGTPVVAPRPFVSAQGVKRIQDVCRMQSALKSGAAVSLTGSPTRSSIFFAPALKLLCRQAWRREFFPGCADGSQCQPMEFCHDS